MNFRDVVIHGGDLVEDPTILSEENLSLSAPHGFTVPAWVDSRPLCLPSSNQGSEPSCAGYATAGYVEVMNWAKTGIQTQIDGSAIYARAKQIDESPKSQGTTLTAAVQAAKDLGFIDEALKVNVIRTRLDFQFALHKNRVCIIGFNITEEWGKVDPDSGFISVGDTTPLGGHAVLGCYYDQFGPAWQNRWNVTWGTKGFGRMTWEQFDKQFLYGVVLG